MNKQIYQFPPKPVPGATDLILLSDESAPGNVVKNCTVGQLGAVIQTLITAKNNIRYVSIHGSDTTGTGTQDNPWQTLNYAISQIIDATPDNTYCVKLLSDIAEATQISLKPCVNLDFSGFMLSANELVLDSSWNNSFSSTINLYVTHGVINLANASVFDFTPYLPQSVLISFHDLLITKSLEFIGTGSQVVNIKDVGNTAEPLNIKIQDFPGSAISGGLVGNLDYINTLVVDGMTGFVVAEVVTGNISLTSANYPLVGFLIGAFSFSQIVGDGPQVIAYTSSTLTQYPAMINGAHWYLIQLNSLQNTLYVTQYGDDEQGDGSAINAYNTITGALTSQRIPGATPENPVEIFVFGKSNDQSMPALPPNVNIFGVNALTPQNIEIDSATWQSAQPGSKNVITGIDVPGVFCNCISPSQTPQLTLNKVTFSVGYFANCTLSMTDCNTINNPSTSNLITFQSVEVESSKNSYKTTEFLVQNGVVNFNNDQFYQNLILTQGAPIIYFLNCGERAVTINATQETVINADQNFSADLILTDSAKLIPIANVLQQSAAQIVTTSYTLSVPLSIHLRVNMITSGQVIILPICKSSEFPIVNVGTRVYIETDANSAAYDILYQDNTFFQTVAAGTSFYLVVNDNGTENGAWDIINDASGGGAGVDASFAAAIFNQDISGSATSGTIAFSDTTTYLPLITFTAPATYSLASLFSVENDGNLHTVFRCQDPAGGAYLLTFNLVLRLINYNSQQSFFMNYGVNGFSAANIDSKKDFPIELFGTTDKSQIPVNYTTIVNCAFNDVLYAPVIRSAISTSAFDTLLKALYWQVTAVKIGNYNLGVTQEAYAPRQNVTSSYVITTPVPFHIYVNMLSSSQSIKLPICNVGGAPTIAVGTRIYFETSSSSNSYAINYADSTAFFASVSPGLTFYLVLNDNTTSNGAWDLIVNTQTVNGVYGMVNVGVDYSTTSVASVSMQANRIYINAYAAGQAVFNAPSTPANKTIIGVYGVTGASTSGWKINAAFGQKFQLGNTVGATGGSIASTSGSFGDGVQCVYDTSSATWIVTQAVGSALTIL
ncbi:MAG TPA: hypothetical protein PLF59_08240 [Cyclobacteriaceae bacterium]|nr:hypothetical protein [Cyclobacteriaceae bacterium]